MCRSRDTSDDPDMDRLRAHALYVDPDDMAPVSPWHAFTLVGEDVYRPQMEVLLSVVLMAGGAVTLSDRMSRLNESGLDLARHTVSAGSGEAAIPLDLLESAVPSYWFQKLKKERRVLMINWEDTPQERSIDLNALGIQERKAVNFWNDKAVRIVRGRITEVLPPRSCLLAVIR